MVRVVVPLRRVAVVEQGDVVGLVFDDQRDGPLTGHRLRDGDPQVVQERRGIGIDDCVRGVEPQSVEAVVDQPCARVFDEERAHVGDAQIDRGAPRRVVALGEERRRVRVEVVPFGTEVVVDHIEQDGEPARVRGADEALEIAGFSIAGKGREREHAIVTPVARPGERPKRHQFDRRHAERPQVVEPLGGGGVRPVKRERADVQLVDHVLVPRPSVPGIVGPGERRHDRTRRVDAVGLKA